MAQLFLNSGTSYARPVDWYEPGHTVELIGPGGDGGGAGSTGTMGGGGGGYIKLTRSSGISQNFAYAIGANCTSTTVATFTTWQSATNTNCHFACSGLAGGTSNAAIAAGTSGVVGTPVPVTYTITTQNDGGTGGNRWGATNQYGAGGGGGAGGPTGVGGKGGRGKDSAGGGGGGANKGYAGTDGGAGGNDRNNTAGSGGAGGNPGADGKTGGGGGGGTGNSATQNGGKGSPDYIWGGTTYGVGGGGGGGGGTNDNTAGYDASGGAGGAYGGGGGGCGRLRKAGTQNPGSGGIGLILVTYTSKRRFAIIS